MLGCIAVGIVSAQTGETEPVTVEGLNYELNAEAKTATVVEGEYAGEINIPENITVEDVVYTVTAIGESAFQEDRNDPDKVTSVTIPNTVETIDAYAFMSCSGLTTVNWGTGVKSVGNSATTPRDLVSEGDVQLMLLLLAESVCSRMRELASRCTVVEIYVRDTELRSMLRQRKLPAPSCSSQELAEVGLELFRRNYHWERPIRSIGLRGAGLVEAVGTVQMSLYAEDQRRDKWERIDRAVDHLRQRYGYMSVRRALLDTDPRLGHINVRDDHTVHPVGYFGG